MQIVDVRSQFAPAHLERLAHFAVEVAGWLRQFGEQGDGEASVAGDRSVGEITDPAGLEHPGLLRFFPARALRINAPAHVEGCGIQLQNIQLTKEIPRRVEELVVINFPVFAEDPLVAWMEIGLGRLALDLVAKSVLLLVGVREIGVVENQHRGSQRESGKEKRQGNAINADAGGLASHDLVVFGHHPERDKHAHERSQGRKLVEKIRREIPEIFHHNQKRNSVARNVVQQLEKREGFKQKDEYGHEQRKIK